MSFLEKINQKGYTYSYYFNKYGYDYRILISAEDIKDYLYVRYDLKLAKKYYEKCLKNIHYLNMLVNILDENNNQEWKDIKKDIFNEKGDY